MTRKSRFHVHTSIPQPTPPATPHQVGLFDDSPPDIAGHTWLAFTLDHPEAQAAATFQARYRQAPSYSVKSLGGLLRVGPIPSLEGNLGEQP